MGKGKDDVGGYVNGMCVGGWCGSDGVWVVGGV